jgi:succinate dehydrogenase / fumarate reductase, iron-sulfur subunit
MSVKVTLKIKRFNPFNPEADRRPHWESYEFDAEPTDRVLDALHHVKWHIDGTLSFRRSCQHGVCGSDAMMINGRNGLACTLLLRDEGPVVTVEPLRAFPVIKDLVVDMDEFFAKYESVLPRLVASDGTECCPRGIRVTQAIGEVKRAILYNRI